MGQPRGKRARLGFAIVAIGGAVFGLAVVNFLLLYSGIEIEVPQWNRGTVAIDLQLLCFPIVNLLVISCVLQATMGREYRGRTQLLSMVLIAITIVGYLVLFPHALVPLSRLSMRGHGPFARSWAIKVITAKGTFEDLDCILQAFVRSGWPKGRTTNVCFGPSEVNWEDQSFELLMRRDPRRTAHALAQNVIRKPSKERADEFAVVFAEHQCYETVPILLRYACEDTSFRSHSALAGLYAMHVPQANLVFEPDLDISAARSPLTSEQRRECDEIIRCMRRYHNARNYIYHCSLSGQVMRVPLPDLNVPTTGELVKEVERYVAQVNAIVSRVH